MDNKLKKIKQIFEDVENDIINKEVTIIDCDLKIVSTVITAKVENIEIEIHIANDNGKFFCFLEHIGNNYFSATYSYWLTYKASNKILNLLKEYKQNKTN